MSAGRPEAAEEDEDEEEEQPEEGEAAVPPEEDGESDACVICDYKDSFIITHFTIKALRVSVFNLFFIRVTRAGEPGASEGEPRAAERERAAVQEAAERASQSGRSAVLLQGL